jgi:hypothetical protein
MKKIKQAILLIGASLFSLESIQAQDAFPSRLKRVGVHSMHTASVDLATGTITRGPAIKPKSAGAQSTITTVANLDFGGFIGVSSGTSSAVLSSTITGLPGNTGVGQSTLTCAFVTVNLSGTPEPIILPTLTLQCPSVLMTTLRAAP